jgi:hypothetical protein
VDSRIAGLTGFDASSLHTMYVDKPMHGHGLPHRSQAIAFAGLREQFRFHAARPVGHRLAGDLVMGAFVALRRTPHFAPSPPGLWSNICQPKLC